MASSCQGVKPRQARGAGGLFPSSGMPAVRRPSKQNTLGHYGKAQRPAAGEEGRVAVPDFPGNNEPVRLAPINVSNTSRGKSRVGPTGEGAILEAIKKFVFERGRNLRQSKRRVVEDDELSPPPID